MTELPMRLAFRVEGAKWNAYVTGPDTMNGAIWVGSIALRFVEHNEKRKQAFIALMTEALGEIIKDIFHQQPIWDSRPAPEHERAKS